MNRVLVLVVFCALLSSLESIVPLFRFREKRLRRALPNLALTAIVVVMNVAFSFVTAIVASKNPSWLAIVIAIPALDFFAYVAHVAMHKSPIGWRFHRVHHSEEEVDVTTAFRQHPGESLWRILWQLTAIALFGIPLWMVAVYLTLSSLNAQLEHANVAVSERFDRIVRLLFATPNMHKIHHSRLQRETDSNYANIFSVWDRLFGTYTRSADLGALRYGLDDVRTPTLRGLLALPFISSPPSGPSGP